MDVSVNPVLESVRPFFQGLPAPAGAPPTTSAGSTASLPSQPGAATPVQPQHGFPTASGPSTSPSALAYWQRPKDSAKSPALASPLHHVYNGKLGEPLQPSAQQPAPEQQRHNLPPIAALSTYPHARSAQGSPHLPLPSISQITPLTKSSTSSLSPRNTPQDQFRTPEYPQSNHHSIYSPNSSSNQSHSRSSSYQTQGSKYSAPSSPASSSPSPHAYSFSPRTSLPTTTSSSPVYNQTTTSNSSHHQRQPQQTQQSRPPSNPTHHPMSPVIQQPNQPEHALLKLHQQQQPPTQYPQHQLPAHSPYSSSQQHQSSHSSQSHQHALYSSHQSQQHPSSQSHLMPLQHQQSQHQKQQPNNLQQQPSVLQHHSSSHQQHSSSHQNHSSSHQHHSSSHQLHSSSLQQHLGGPQHNLSSHQQLLSSSQHHSSVHQLTSSSQQHLSSLQHHSSSLQQLSSNIHQHSSTLQQLSSSVHQHPSNIQQHTNAQQKSSILQQKPSYIQHATGHHQSQSQQSNTSRHQSQSQAVAQHPSSQLPQHSSSSQQPHQGFAQYKTQPQQSQRHEQTQAARSQHLLTQQQHQLQQQTNLYNQSVQQSEADQLTEMLRIKERQLAVAQAQQQAYYAAASSTSSTRPSSRPTTIEANNQQQTTTTQALTGRVKRESPLDLSVKTVRQSADSTAKDDSESLFHVNFQNQEASFQHRSKLPVKTASPRSSTLLPSLQLPPTVIYPHFDHPSNQTASSGAPKVDFLPNFQAHHGPSAGKSAHFQDPGKRQTKTSVSQQPSPQYPSHLASLPHMATFKKSSLPSAAYDDSNKQSQYYPTTSLSNTQRPASLTNHSSSSHVAPPNSHYPFDSSKRGSSARYDFLERRNSSSSSHSSISSDSNFHLGKRQSSSDLKHPLPPKIPRVVDTWRQTIDQQIEQRLSSYASSRGHHVNGTTKESSTKSDASLHQQNIPPLSSSSSSNIQSSHGINLQSSNLSSRTLQSSHPPNYSSKFDLSSQYFPHNQLQYPSLNLPPRSSHELYNNLSHVKIPNLPNNGAADKRVLSILRKRLDNREATNHMIQQQTEAAHNQERSKMYSSLGSRIYPQSMIVPSPILASQCNPPVPTPIARHNLPPFNALSLERSASMPYPTQKLHIPKAMDSVPPEHAQSSFMPRNDVVPMSPLSSQTEAIGKPGSGENNGDCDGLTAYLAARIRTKAELKQVGPSVEQQRTPTLASESNSSTQSPRTTPGIFSPPPSLNTGCSYPAVPGDFSKGTPTSESDRASSSGHSNSSPMKSFRDRYGINSPRRKLFCRPEDEQCSTLSEGVIQARERGLRSSSETSVFDFRESDSDGETASERQSLHEMRKDRDRRLQEKHQNVPASSLDPTSDLIEINDSEPIDDSFWSGMCDKFVHQLQKGGMKVRKKGRQRKWKYIPIELEEPDPELECNVVPEPSSNVLVSKKESMTVIEKDTDLTPQKDNIQEEPLLAPCGKDTIKIEKEEEESVENLVVEFTVPCIAISKATIKKEEESSDEDVPLSLRQSELKKEKKAGLKIDVTSNERDGKLTMGSECSKTFVKLEKLSKEDIKKGLIKQEPKSKTDASDSEADTSADESIESVAKRLRIRKPKEETAKPKRKTKPKEKENSGTSPIKGAKKKKGEKKKSVFGDGTEFRPGWEAEVYRYKRSLRMPARLINIAGPQNWPRLSVSLPDLDPDSPMTLDSDITSLQNKQFDSDYESTPTKAKSKDRKSKTPQKKVEEKGEEDSFINRLIQRYGGKGKKSLRKAQEKDCSKERKVPKTIPQTNELKLLPTPSLDCIVKTPVKKSEQNASQSKHTKGKKGGKLGEPVDLENKDAVFLGYFRKKTVAEFRDAFAKHNGGFATEHELPPIVLKSRTRTQTRILTQRATIREVFGEDRPASAPPAGCREEENDNSVSDSKKPKKLDGKSKKLLNKLSSNNGISVGTRTGLRSAAVLRSNKAVLKSKQQLLHGGERRKRDKDLIKSYTFVKKYKKDNDDITVGPEIKIEDQEEDLSKVEEDVPVLASEKRLKYKSVRRKLKSSGFDYIRKKKKHQQKREGEAESFKDKKKATPPKPVLESEEDIQNEIKGWVINKGLGETVLHRAARLGYTDIAAYCLEKMEHSASPRDNAGYTPLHEACSKGRLDIARLLLQYGADPSDSAQGGIRPLHEASEHGCLEMIRLLLSYGADPLLATYSGHTPLSLSGHHPEARALLQNHLADVQGLTSVPWPIQELADPALLGNDPMVDAPSPDPGDIELEIECAELSLPNLYQLLGEPISDRWVLFQELGPILRVKTREALIKQLGPSHRNDFRDLKMTEFYNMARCCTVLGVGDHTLNPKAHKVTLVKYSDRVRVLLNSEIVIVR